MRKKTAQFIETQKASISPERSRKKGRGKDKKPRKVAPASIANLEKGKDMQFQPGQSGNPGGLPGKDLATDHARRFIERAGSIEGFATLLPKNFNAYAYSVLAERAYGKMKQEIGLSGSVELVNRLRAAMERKAKLNKANGDSGA